MFKTLFSEHLDLRKAVTIKKHLLLGLLFALSSLSPLCARDKPDLLYNSLDPLSFTDHITLASLYPDHPVADKALTQAWFLLTKSPQLSPPDRRLLILSPLTSGSTKTVTEEQRQLIELLGKDLAHRQLKGFHAQSEEEVLQLENSDIDLARGLLLCQSEGTGYQHFEALLDFMALQVRARLPESPGPQETLQAINRLVFRELNYRFPPQSLYSKQIDRYTFLPEVLNSRKGVCLGVSTLYLCLAQRLGLPMEAITPPGHIYIRYRDEERVINVETTARGVNLDTEVYLSLRCGELPVRTYKEVIGLTLINQASVFLHQGNSQQALECYQRAENYLPSDAQLQLLKAATLTLEKKESEARVCLKKAKKDPRIAKDSLFLDLWEGVASREGLMMSLMGDTESREERMQQREEWIALLQKTPRFRSGWFQLASLYLQLGRPKEAWDALQSYHTLDDRNPTVEFLLTLLALEQKDLPSARKHLLQARECAEYETRELRFLSRNHELK